jgi:hypothetical protein
MERNDPFRTLKVQLAFVAAVGQGAWMAIEAFDGTATTEPVRALVDALGDVQLAARSWFLGLDDPGLGRRFFNGHFWRFQTARLEEPRPAPGLASD